MDRHIRFALLVIATAVVATTTSAGASTKWTEFGATKKAWYATHVLDPNMPPYRGCCFLPRQRDGTDRYNGVSYYTYGGVVRVVQFEMWLDPPISLAAARNVVWQAAPPESRLVRSTRTSECVVMQFKSNALTRAFKLRSGKAPPRFMEAELTSPAKGRPSFNPNSVADILFLTLPVLTKGC